MFKCTNTFEVHLLLLSNNLLDGAVLNKQQENDD